MVFIQILYLLSIANQPHACHYKSIREPERIDPHCQNDGNALMLQHAEMGIDSKMESCSGLCWRSQHN